jgi:hypothetical protein
MPCRLIRDDMLESERVLGLPVEARWLYVSILLTADDLGCFEASAFRLARRSDIRRETVEQLLGMLADQDLVRLYEASGKRFGFIPRFRQRIQIKFLKNPPPPVALMQDDEDALNKIKQLTSKTTVGNPLDNRCPSAGQPSEAKAKAKAKDKSNAQQAESAKEPESPPEEADRAAKVDEDEPRPQPQKRERRVEIALLLREQGVAAMAHHPTVVAWAQTGVTDEQLTEAVGLARLRKPTGSIPVGYLEPIVADLRKPAPPVKRSTADWWTSDRATDAKARELGMQARPGEEYPAFRARMRDEIERRDRAMREQLGAVA